VILELQIGESIAVRFDDDINDERPTPEVVEDYLTRMRRTAVDLFNALPNDTPDADVLAALDPDVEGES